jgi:lipopolysaccharide/colanic/teichoic acid biosynthesis glycosyltransferase
MSRLGVSASEVMAGVLESSPARARLGRALDVACRSLDLLISAAMLVLLSPVFLAIALAIRLDSPGPALFRQQRIGRNLVPFTVMKFRTMRHGADDRAHHEFVVALIAGDLPEQVGEGPRFKMNGDPRVTRLGHYLRRSSLDELPQLWNVVRGHMSLVGPRPPISYEVDHYPQHWFPRFAVKPGLTGLWQVSGRSELTLEEMIALDLEYVERRSPLLNLWILIRTVPVVVSRRGAS